MIVCLLYILYTVIYSQTGIKVFACEETILPEPMQSHSVCFGTHREFQASCEHINDSVIATQNICVGSKRNSTGCPSVVREDSDTGIITDSDGNSVDIDQCCNPNYTSDCIFPYHHPSNRYHVQCNGLRKCTDVIPASQADTACVANTHDPYLTETSYFFMIYACIHEPRIGSISSVVNMTTTDGTALYLQNPSYPGAISSTIPSAECSVQTDECVSHVHVFTIDLHLADNDLDCKQTISISTTSGHGILWTCDNHTLYAVTKTTLTEQYLVFTFNNSLSFDGGHVWLGFAAAASTANLMIHCPPIDKVACVNRTVPETTPNPTNGTIPTETNQQPGSDDAKPPQPGSDKGDAPVSGGLIGGVVSAIVILGIIIVACIVYRVQHRTRRGQVGPTPNDHEGGSIEAQGSQEEDRAGSSNEAQGSQPEDRTNVPPELQTNELISSLPPVTYVQPYTSTLPKRWDTVPPENLQPPPHGELPPIRGVNNNQ